MFYYAEKLSAERLKRVYEIAPPRMRQYLEAEIEYVMTKIRPSDIILELGTGYGRILPYLARITGTIMGIDSSLSSLRFGSQTVSGLFNCQFACMDAVKLAFQDDVFDMVVCIQNGISAFHVDQKELIAEAVRVTKAGGTVLFSSYSEKFWPERLEWFRMQSEAGLLGEIDYEKTKDGVIVCKDGFSASTVSESRFRQLTAGLDGRVSLIEIDESSLFCEIIAAKK